MKKTVKQLKLNDGTNKTTQEDILKQIKSFYQNLFSNKDDSLRELEITSVLKDSPSISKLSSHQTDLLEGQLNLDEISQALYKMKNNKTLGIGGFPADFCKVFWV